MGLIDRIELKIRRGEGPVYGGVRKLMKGMLHSNLPLPSFVRPVYRGLYQLHYGVLYGFRWGLNYFYREPAFRSRCVHVGKNLHMWLMPDISGPVQVYIGDGVNLFGHLGVQSGRIYDTPKLIIENGADIGHNVTITVNQEVFIGEEANIASGVRILDSDAHPRDPQLRIQGLPPSREEIKPVRIERHAWIGQNAFVMKGVTVGEGAIIGANSVVITDIPPFSVAIGNPARVVVKDVRVGAQPAAAPAASPAKPTA